MKTLKRNWHPSCANRHIKMRPKLKFRAQNYIKKCIGLIFRLHCGVQILLASDSNAIKPSAKITSWSNGYTSLGKPCRGVLRREPGSNNVMFSWSSIKIENNSIYLIKNTIYNHKAVINSRQKIFSKTI